MKYNTLRKLFIALAAVVILCTLAFTVFAETGAENPENAEQSTKKLPEAAASKGKKQHRSGRSGKRNGDWLEDWFEDRIEARSCYADFSELPEDPTDEEIVEFFKKYFLGGDPVKMNEGEYGKNPWKDCSRDKDRDLGKESDSPVIPEVPETEAEPSAAEPEAAPAEEQPASETAKDAA